MKLFQNSSFIDFPFLFENEYSKLSDFFFSYSYKHNI